MPLPSLHPLLALVASSALLISSPLTVSGAPDRTAAVLSFERTTRAGARVDVLVQFTDTAVPLNGRWQLVAGHVSRLAHDRG